MEQDGQLLDRKENTDEEIMLEGQRPKKKEKELSFNDIMSVFLRLRGAHNAKVTDFVELREYLRHNFERLEKSVTASTSGGSLERDPFEQAARSGSKDSIK